MESTNEPPVDGMLPAGDDEKEMEQKPEPGSAEAAANEAAPAEPVPAKKRTSKAAAKATAAAEPEAAGADRQEQSALDAELPTIQPGDLVEGKVVELHADHALVDVGYKSDGFLPLDEISHQPITHPKEALAVGDVIQVLVLRNDGEEDVLRLSKRRADERAVYEQLQEAMAAKTVLEAPVTEVVKGGLVVNVGIRGFVPASQVERGFIEDLSAYAGQTLRLQVIEVDRRRRRVILSHRKVVEAERSQVKGQLWDTLAEGQRLSGRVKSLTDFGAFIDLGGVDGLLHISEMSWSRVRHPSAVLKEGETVEVAVLRLDREKGRVSLGLKQVQANPWQDIDRRFPEGSIVKGEVARLTPFGAFISLEPGVDGLVHISHLSDERIERPDEVVKIGDQIRVKVLRVDPDLQRISLSLKEVAGPGVATVSSRSAGESKATIADMLDEETKQSLGSGEDAE
ncbi:MAG: 30S ribosomal protein S1 [Sulfobacillus sp.]